MRAPGALALLLLVLALPPGAAQPDLLPEPELAIAPFAGEVRPLQGVSTANATLRVPCALAAHPQGTEVAYQVASKPAWAVVVVSPSSDVAQASACVDGIIVLRATLTVSATDQSPAHAPAPLRLQAEVRAEPSPRTAAAETNVTAAYFPLLDVALSETQRTVAPGGRAEYPLTLTNVGNGRTRVRFELMEATDGITVELPQALSLDSRQQGSPSNSATVQIVVRAAPASGVVNRVDVANVRVVGEDETGLSPESATSTVALLATVRSEVLDKAKGVPAPPAALLLAALGAAAWARRGLDLAEKRG